MAQLLKQIIGHEHQIDLLFTAVDKKHLPSCLIFTGLEGIGKQMVAKVLAQKLNCDYQETAPCGQCGSCLRIEKLQSESVLFIEPEKNIIKIEQAHEITHFLSLRGGGRAKLVIINQAHLMNSSAANSLLKMFEEPPDDTYFILITANHTALMPTILSRSQILRFRPLSEEQLKKNFKGEAWQIHLSQGSVKKLKEMNDPAEIQIKETAWVHFESWVTDRGISASSAFKELEKERPRQVRYYYYLSLIFKDLALMQSEEVPTVASQQKMASLLSLVPWSPQVLLDISLKALEQEAEIAANADVSLTFEKFWYTINKLWDSSTSMHI